MIGFPRAANCIRSTVTKPVLLSGRLYAYCEDRNIEFECIANRRPKVHYGSQAYRRYLGSGNDWALSFLTPKSFGETTQNILMLWNGQKPPGNIRTF